MTDVLARIIHEYRREAAETEAWRGFSQVRATQADLRSVEETEREKPRQAMGSAAVAGIHELSGLGACPSNAILLRQTICRHLRRSRPEKILNVFPREGTRLGALGADGCNKLRLRFFRACGLASASISFPSQRKITRTDS
jgi:hypothetical protein